jgi:hypothetical protein
MHRETSGMWEDFLPLPSIVGSAGGIGTIMHGTISGMMQKPQNKGSGDVAG